MTATATRRILERFPAGGPRGSWPAEEKAAQLRAEGKSATVVQDIHRDVFLVVAPAEGES